MNIRYRQSQNGDDQALLSVCSVEHNCSTDSHGGGKRLTAHPRRPLISRRNDIKDDKCGPRYSLCDSKVKGLLCVHGNGRWSKPSRVVLLVVLLLVFFFLPWSRFFVHSSDNYQKHLADLKDLRQQYATIPPDVKVSAVVMNHNRPRMIRESLLMKTLLEHTAVDQIILTHSNPATKFTWDDPKIINIDAVAENEKMGLSLRFAHCAASHHTTTNKYQWVLIVDDDMEFTAHAVDDLIRAMLQNQDRIVGHYGRGYHYRTALLRHGYHTRTLFGHVEVVLTKFMMVHRNICAKFFDYEHLVHDFVAQSHPKWNGEDIFLNLVANHEYKVPANGPYNNWAMADLQVWEASDEFKDDDTGANDVSGNMDRHQIWNIGVGNWIRALIKANAHARFRGEFWDAAKARLRALE